MKLYWEEKDIMAGMIVKKPGTMGKGWIIGKRILGSLKYDWYLTSLDDGTMGGPYDRGDMAKTLTENGDLPFDFLRVWNDVNQ